MVTIAVLLELKEIGVVIAAFEAFTAEAVKFCTLPISRETSVLGDKLRLAGTGLVEEPGLPFPQPGHPIDKIKNTITHPTEPDLPMHPPRPIAACEASTLCIGNFHSRGRHSFQQVGCR
jgi:hypothetical protein